MTCASAWQASPIALTTSSHETADACLRSTINSNRPSPISKVIYNLLPPLRFLSVGKKKKKKEQNKSAYYTYTVLSTPIQRPNASAKKTSKFLRTKHPATKTHSPKKLPKRWKCAPPYQPSPPNATTISPTATAYGVK